MANDEQIGRVINRNWRVVRKLGQGGMGTVWEVRHKDVRRLRSAVKEIREGLSTNQEVVRRFLREVRLMAELEGVDHIVRVTEFDREEGFVFMTLVDGPSLAQIIERQGALAYEQVLRFGKQVAAALGVVHERGIVHRDIKPPNVLVDEKQQKAYLTDFGIAKKLDLSEGDETIDGTLTLEGTLTVDVQYMGTPRYSSPEQLRVEYPPHPLWDIYAMGVLLYEAYSGLKCLPQFRKYHEFLRTVGTDPAFEMTLQYPTPPPPQFAAIVAHCVQRDPAQRLQRAVDLAARLEECEEELHRQGIGSGVPRRPSAPSFEDQETLREDFRDPRHDLREEIERGFGTLEELEGTLVAVGLNLPAGPASETLSHALRDISVIEGEGQFQEALGRLEALREQAAAAQARAQQAVRAGLELRVAELQGARQELEPQIGRWLDRTLLAPVDDALGAAQRGLADGDWKVAGDRLSGVSEHLQAAADAARAAARAAAEAAVAESADQLAAVQRLDPSAVPSGVDLAALRAQVEAHLATNQFNAAVQHAEATRAIVTAARARAHATATDQLRAAGAALERQLGELDIDAAQQTAPDAMADLERARAAAAAADAAGDMVAALAAYADAGRAAGAAGTQVAAAQAAERRQLAEALSAIVAATADAPSAVVGDARAAAQAVLAQPPPVHAAAVAALTDAATRLATARARSQQEQCAALDAALHQELEGLAGLDAECAALGLEANDTPTVAVLRDALEAAGAHAQRGAFDAALAGLGALRARAAQVRTAREAAVRGALAAAATAVAERSDELAARAGALLVPARRADIERIIARVEAAARDGSWAAARTALADAEGTIERTDAELRRGVEATVREQLTGLEAGLRRLTELGATAPPGIDAEALGARSAALLAGGQLAAARQAVDEAAATVEALRAARERELTAQAGAARAAADASRRGLDLDAARAVAPVEVGRAERSLQAAADAEQRRSYVSAISAYEAAAAAFGAAASALAEQQRAELAAQRAAARNDLLAVVERARPALADVVGETLRTAEALLDEKEPAPEALAQAGDALTTVLDDVPAYLAAVERRAAAEARQAEVTPRRLSRRQLEPSRQRLRAAAAALAERQWAAAAERYGEAERLFAELAAVPVPKPTRWPYAVVAAVLLAAAVLVLYRLLPTAETGSGRPAAPVHVARIASAQPAAADVSLNEGASQIFSIQLADTSGGNPDIEWRFAGKPVADARGKTEWDYRPDFSASAGSPYDVTVTVGGGATTAQTHAWRVAIADQNRLPELVKVLPPQNQEITKEVGQTASFAVEANDADGDPLTYQWTVDGKPIGGNTPAFEVPVERARATVALAITDGKQPVPLHLEWQLSGREALWVALPPILKQLAFGAAQTFKLTPPAAAPAGVQIAWAVNGQKVADGPSFLYQVTDPDLVGAAPVQVRATASDPTGKPFTREWSFAVTPPPPPKLTAASPPAGVIEAASGTAQKLTLSVAAPVNGQRFTYLFDVNGKQTTAATPSLSVAPADSGDTLVVAAIEDNFKQRSKETRWTIRPAAKPVAPAGATADAAALVRGWLEQYRGALNGKDVPAQCSLLALDAGKCAQLTTALATQGNLHVAFDNVTVEPQADGRVRAQYTRVDDFVDPSGRPQARKALVTQTFRLVNGKALLDKSGQ